MRGLNVPSQSTNYATTSLFNNSTGRDLLALWAIGIQTQGGGFTIYGAAFQGSLGTVSGTVAPLVTGDAPQYGQIYYADSATPITPDYQFANYLSPVYTQPFGMPYTILQPQWSYVIQDIGTGTLDVVSFLWQAVHREDLEGRHCPECDITLVVAS